MKSLRRALWKRSSVGQAPRQPRLAGLTLTFLVVVGCTVAPESIEVVATFDGGTIEVDQLDSAPRQVDDPDADWRVEAIRDLAIRQSLLARAAAAATMPVVEAAAEQTARNAMIGVLSKQLGWDAITVSEDEIRGHFDAHPAIYESAAQLRLQHIYLRADRDQLEPGELEAIRARAEALQREVGEGADFTSIARRSSESETAFSGGHMTLKATDRVFPAFAEAAWKLEEGEVSDVVEVDNGFHILTLRQRIEERARPFDEVRQFARTRALEAKVETLRSEWLSGVAEKYDLEKHYELLEDPFVDFGAALLTFRGGSYTVSQLAADLPPKLIEHFYQGYFPKVHEFLDGVALRQILLLEAQSLGLREDPAVLAAAEAARPEATYQAIFRQRLQAKAAEVPDEALEEFYWQNEERYKRLRGIDLTMIHLPLEKGKSLWDKLREGEALAERIRQGESMEALAREFSRHYSAAGDGRYFNLTDPEMAQRVQSTARFRRQFESLSPGEITVLRAECYDMSMLGYVDTGVLVVRLDRLVPPVQAPFEEVRELVRENYVRRYYQRIVKELRDELIEEIDLKIFTDRLPAT